MISRDYYLNQLIKYKDNDKVKIVTGLRRSGKSWLLNHIFRKYLIDIGIDATHIIFLDLELDKNIKYWDPLYLGDYIRSLIKDSSNYYVIIDEIQKCYSIKNPSLANGEHVVCDASEPNSISFVNTVLGLQSEPNIDVYVTGSNSKMLSKDILTDFRDKGIEIKIQPFSFSEFLKATTYQGEEALYEYLLHGGMPYVLTLNDNEEKEEYLSRLISMTYLKDIIERNHFSSEDALLEIGKILSSDTAHLINPDRIANTFNSVEKRKISRNTVASYLKAYEDSFIVSRVERYDIKGRKHIGASYKYYFADLGLRNALINFQHDDFGQVMENALYNELIHRKFNVDIGVIITNEVINNSNAKPQYEVDFIATKGNKKYYIQCAFEEKDEKKKVQERKSLSLINDSFKKIVIVKGYQKEIINKDGIYTMGLFNFLSNLDSID